ncbi:hypothetical protein NAT47_05315 [Flavobacterium sp. HXWNR69]|uniref:Prolyl-tRNA synthetase n=1 Tax=Flavobacterium fragile TaxID=2949085 RepID=A0ABT0THE6_9FLAO|nr:hypothetical protein [Flavobacterium sp. HXWNR69]MCL9769830.1 hypothetical protein [Flavobacterium sp. HXWNR69]
MKTYYLYTQKNAIFTLFGLLAVITTSCGSYQNSSYYDNDGVYGSERPSNQVENKYSEQNLEKSNKYAQQFKNMQEEYVVFTDVDNYSSNPQDTVVTVYRNEYGNHNYAGWGNNASNNVTVNYYNNGWGWNNWYSPYWGGGWNSWYGPSWGLGWNSWYGANWGWGFGWNSWYGAGWGWNNWYYPNYGWNGGYYHGGRDVIYNGSIRGGHNNYNNPRGGRNIINNNRSNTPRPNFNNNRGNTRPQENGVRPSSTPRNNNYSTPRNDNNSTPRNNNYSTPRNNNYSTPRSGGYSSPPRSSSGGSFGGGGSRGGGGGSRGGRG